MTKSNKLTVLIALILTCFAQAESPYDVEDPKEYRTESTALLSLLMPGYGQWKEGQTGWALGYSGAAVGGLIFTGATLAGSGEKFQGIKRETAVGLQIYQTAGSLSAFHSFRTVAKQKQKQGEYDFLKIEETPDDLLLAPFRFDYLIRPTTFVPLIAVGALFFAALPNSSNERVDLRTPTAGDWAFTGAVSYNAGVGEEALFRGYLTPALMNKWRNPYLTHLATAGVFALAHVQLDKEKFFVPWPQFVAGLYLGWLSQYRDWTISESIFIHTWYDVMALGAHYATQKALFLRLPTINFRF